MPELPEVETVRRALAPALEGHRIVEVDQRRPDLRFPLPECFAQRIAGARVEAVRRRAKFILVALDTGETLLMHLGMSGRVLIVPRAEAETGGGHAGAQETVRLYHGNGRAAARGNLNAAELECGPDTPTNTLPLASDVPRSQGHLPQHDHIVFTLDDGTRIVFNDHRRFGYMDLFATASADESRHLCRLGPEPLSNRFSAPYLNTALAGRTSPIKAALLDQRIVAGLGNIYVCEALYRAGVSPRRRSGTIPGRRAERLVPAIREVLEAAIIAGGSTLRDYVHADGGLGYFQHAFDVYDREGEDCRRPGCAGTVRRIVQSGRSTFYCSLCQR